MQLHKLRSLGKKRKRIGRGGSRGGTSGKGHKGQKARSGGLKGKKDFEGGQMPLTRRLPKRGFKNVPFAKEYVTVNISALENLFDNEAIVSKKTLREKGVIKGKKVALLKVLGKGKLSKKLTVYTDAISKSATQAIKDLGGQVHVGKE